MMNKLAFALLGCSVLVSPAYAWQTPKHSGPDHASQEPTHVSDKSPVCTVPYNPNDAIRIDSLVGMTVTVEFGPSGPSARTVEEVAVSDLLHIKKSKKVNILWLKPTEAIPSQPISVRAVRDEDGKSEVVMMQFEASESIGDHMPCNLIRITYPQDAAEVARADAAKRRAAWSSAVAARQLRDSSSLPTAGSTLNQNYSLTGNPGLLPRQLAPGPRPSITVVAPAQPSAPTPTVQPPPTATPRPAAPVQLHSPQPLVQAQVPGGAN